MVNSFCGVSGCHKQFYPGCGISFHRLPSNAEMRRKWLEFIPGKLTDSSIICSLHFKPEDYLTEARKKLKPGVIPSVFPKISPERIQVASFGAENVKLESSQGPPTKEIKIEVDISTQTTPSSVSPREAELKREISPERIQVASFGAENVKPESSQGPPTKKIKIKVDISTQTTPSSVSPREAELKRELKIMKQRIKRRDIKIKNLESLLTH